MARYSYKNFDLDNDVFYQIDQPVQYRWSFTSAGVGSDDSGNKWVDATMSSYVVHAVASGGDSTAVKDCFGGTLNGNITSQDLYYAIGTKYFGMTDITQGFSWSEGTNVKKMYVVMLDKDLILDKIKAGTFKITLTGGVAASFSGSYSFVLNTVADDDYPHSTTIRYDSSHGALSSTNVGMALLDDGIFCFLTKGNEAGSSGLLTQLFDANAGTPLTQSNLREAFTSGGKGTIQSLTGNSVEYQSSSIFFCRAYNKEFNYSLNPTFGTSASTYVGTYRLRNEFRENPTTFITGIGLYNNGGDLLATAKLNVPRKKDPYSEALFRVKIII